MSDTSPQILQVLSEMRDLLRLLAEPAIAERDKKLRDTLKNIIGASASKNAKAVFLMDGSRTQVSITKECGIHKGQLSGLVKKLNTAELLNGDPIKPRLAISLPTNFFD